MLSLLSEEKLHIFEFVEPALKLSCQIACDAEFEI